MNNKCRKDCNLNSHLHNQQLDLSIDKINKKQTNQRNGNK